MRWVTADVAAGTDVAAAVEGADVVYYLVHSLGARDFEQQDRQAAANVSACAARAGVKQIVYLGGLGETTPPPPRTSGAGARRASVWRRTACP